MDQPRQPVMKFDQWVGLASNVDPHNLPPGANVEQVNLTVLKAGELRCREGLKEVTWDA